MFPNTKPKTEKPWLHCHIRSDFIRRLLAFDKLQLQHRLCRPVIFALILHPIWIFLIRPFWGNGGTVVKRLAGHSLGSHGPRGRPGHRLGKAGHPVLQSSPSFQIPGEAPHCLVIPKGQNKEILPVQERMSSRHLSHYPIRPEGSSLCLSFCFW